MPTIHFNRRRAALLLGAVLLGLPALAADNTPEFALTIKNHRFVPAELKVPANQRVRLVIENQDATPEEFESHSLNREKLVPPGAKVSVFIGPLQPGRYEFYGEYHEDTAKGVIVAVAP